MTWQTKIYGWTLALTVVSGNSLSRLRLDLRGVDFPLAMAVVTLLSASALFASRNSLSRLDMAAVLTSIFFVARDGPSGVVWLYLVCVPAALLSTIRGRDALSWLSERWKVLAAAYIVLHSYGAEIFSNVILDVPYTEPTVALLGPMTWIGCVALLCASGESPKESFFLGLVATLGILYSQSRAAFLAFVLVLALHLITMVVRGVGSLKPQVLSRFHTWLPSMTASRTKLIAVLVASLLSAVPFIGLNGRYGEANILNFGRAARVLLPNDGRSETQVELSNNKATASGVENSTASGVELGDPLTTRSSWWREGVSSWTSAGSPVLGLGFGEPILRSTVVEPVTGIKKSVRWLHNDFLEILLRAGFLALLLFGIGLRAIFSLLNAVFDARRRTLLRSLGAWIVVAVSVALLMATQPVVWYPGNYVLIILLLFGGFALDSEHEGVGARG